jgi:hypothetical protein
MPPVYKTEDGGMLSNEDREAKAAQWLQRLQEAASLKESLVDYCRRHGLRPGEAYQWKRNLRSAGRWPVLPSEAAETSRSTVVARTAPPGFARVCIAGEPSAISAPLHLQLHLLNGRRAELVLSDERQLPRVLELLEQST